mgnify:CR=1 FL=1
MFFIFCILSGLSNLENNTCKVQNNVQNKYFTNLAPLTEQVIPAYQNKIIIYQKVPTIMRKVDKISN